MKLPAVKPLKFCAALERLGWRFVRQRGSHHIYTKGNKVMTVPVHNKDFKKGTLNALIAQSGISKEDFIKNS